MRTVSLLACLLLAATAIAVMPSADAMELPPQCVTQPCCFAPCPPPCDGCEPDPVRCRTVGVATSDVFAYNGPHAGVDLNSDCSVDVWEHGLVCPKDLTEGGIDRAVGPVQVSADTCAPDLTCTCPPLAATLD